MTDDHPTGPPRERRTTAPGDLRHRLPIVVLLVLALVAAVVAGEPPPARGPVPVTDAVAMPPAGARSSAWYCPAAAGPGATDPTVAITNLADQARAVTLTAMGAKGPGAAVRREVGARSLLEVRVATLGRGADAGVVVEPFGDQVAVEHRVHGPDGFALGPCSTTASRAWYFAAGSSLRGATTSLSLFDPFGEDAIVDVSFTTDAGILAPEELQGLVVSRRSVVVVDVGRYVVRRPSVATKVSVRVGRVVAEQWLHLSGSQGRGVSASLGAVAPASDWAFADGETRPGERRVIGLYNPGELPTSVDVAVVADDGTAVAPTSVQLAGQSVASVDMSRVVPDGLRYATLVSAPRGRAVVAEELASWQGGGLHGAVTDLGAARPAGGWVFGRSRLSTARESHLAIFNSGGRPVQVSVRLLGDGRVVAPLSFERLEVPAGRRVLVPVTTVGPPDAGVEVQASGPVVAVRVMSGPEGVSRSLGIPVRG